MGGKRYSLPKVSLIVLIVVGAVIAVPWGTPNADGLGVALSIVSTLAIAGKTSLSALLMKDAKKDGLTPIVLVWYDSIFSICLLLIAQLMMGEWFNQPVHLARAGHHRLRHVRGEHHGLHLQLRQLQIHPDDIFRHACHRRQPETLCRGGVAGYVHRPHHQRHQLDWLCNIPRCCPRIRGPRAEEYANPTACDDRAYEGGQRGDAAQEGRGEEGVVLARKPETSKTNQLSGVTVLIS